MTAGAPPEAEMAALAARLRGDTDEGSGKVHLFPIRHHSPACALHLARALEELRPAALVLEMPADFAPLVPLILDPATRPPVAVVSLAGAGGDAPSVSGYWPLSASSPELVALRHAGRTGARLVLADLPSGARLQDPDDAPAEGELPEPVALTGERPIAYGDYARALVRRTGSRDFNEAWDRLFESRAAEGDWRGFFADVGVHCALARRTAPEPEMRADGTLARERAMRAGLRDAVAGAAGGAVAVVLGGFHVPAVLDLSAPESDAPGSDAPGSDAPEADAPEAEAPEAGPRRPARSYLVRYGHRQLDRLNGYAAGMPSPLYYERLHGAAAARTAGSDAGGAFAAVAEDALVGLAVRLRAERPALAPALPTLVEALHQARGLAELRGLPGPGRCEILDAARSCFLKDEDPRHGSPLGEALERELAGEGIGDVPRSAGSPPIVEAARARARALGFAVDDGAERRRRLDIHRDPRHRAASRFLHAMALLGTGFGRRLQGPDFRAGVGVGALFEAWSCAWSPAVEGRLVALAGDGDTVERAGLTALRRRAAELLAGGAGDARAVAELVLLAAQAGLAAAGAALLARLGEAVARDPEFPRVVGCLSTLDLLWRGRAVLGLTGAPALLPLVGACYRRAVDLMPRLASAQGDAVAEGARALADLHRAVELSAGPGDAPVGLDRALFDEAVAALLAADPPPLVAGAVGALAHLAGRIDGPALARIVCGALGGTAAPEERSAPLAGLLAVQPALLRRCDALVVGVDALFERMDEADFLDALPGLRLALTALDPSETDDLAHRVAALHGLPTPLLRGAESDVTAAEAIDNARRSAELAACLAADGLSDWLGMAARPHPAEEGA